MSTNTFTPLGDITSLSRLCTTCQTTGPWSPAGWKDFHTRESQRTNLSWMNEEPNLYTSVTYDVDVDQFYADAEVCGWCSLLCKELGLPPTLAMAKQERDFTSYYTKVEFRAPEGIEPRRVNAVLVMVMAGQGEDIVPFFARFGVLARPGLLASDIFFAPRTTRYRESQFDHELASRWIEQCNTQHHKCKNVSVADSSEQGDATLPLLPTRILEVSAQPDNPHAPSIVLREATPGERGRYICMSYTWGPHRRHNFAEIARSLLHRGTAEEERDSPTVELPAVFTDAAHVALRLGIRFLWIDALCIWQDDPVDLKAELSQMHRYYRDTTVVVQTSGTASVDDNFLGETRNVDDVGRLMAQAADRLDCEGDGDGAGTFLRLPYLRNEYGDESGQDQGHGQGSDRKTLRAGEVDDNTEEKKVEATSNMGEKLHYLQHAKPDDIIYICPLSALPALYNPDTEPSAARGWIFQEQNLCRRLLTFPSGGGMLFRCDSSKMGGLSDGQVNFQLSTQRISQRTRGRYSWWVRDRLMKTTDFPDGITHLPLNDRLLVQVDSMRRLAALGNTPELVMLPGGGVSLTLNLTSEEKEKRSRLWAKKKAQQLQMERQNQIGLTDADLVQVSAEATGNDADSDTGGVTDEVQDLTRRTQAAGLDDQLEEDTSDEIDADETAVRFKAFKFNMTFKYPDGTSHHSALGPHEHPLLEMSCGEQTTLVATGPWPGNVFLAGVREVWKALVNEYCSRRLTDPRDKLVAMSALATAFAEHYGPEVLGGYDAGVWREFAGEGLLWYSVMRRRSAANANAAAAETEGADSQLDVKYDATAPSWSWAAVPWARYHDPKTDSDNGVDYDALDFKILALQTTLAENSPARGAVAPGGTVRVACLVMDVWWALDTNSDGDEIVNLFTAEHGGGMVGKRGVAYPDHRWLFPASDGKRERVLMLLGRRFVLGVGHNNDPKGECLLLRPKEAEHGEKAEVASGEYVRVGFAMPVFWNFEQDWRSRFRQAEITIY